jgi:hypothetical protein
MIEGKVAAVEFKDTMPEEPVQDQMVHDKIKEIESKLASLKSSDPWANAAANRPAGSAIREPVFGNKSHGPGIKSTGKGKGGGKSEKRAEEKTRTLFFTNFPKGSRSGDSKAFVKEKLGDAVKKLEEPVYTYDDRTTKGMARFQTTDDMWQYMTSDCGRLKLQFQGRRIYVDIHKEGEDAQRERAVRKSVHLLIKHGGGDGETIKKGLDISYRQGSIWKGDSQLADWNQKELKMTLMDEAAGYTSEFEALMAA